jgi:hypothetical protein
MFDVPDKIADHVNLLGSGVGEKINAHKFIFDQYHQLELIEPIEAEIVSQIRFICNFLGINICVLGNELTNFVAIGIHLHRDPKYARSSGARGIVLILTVVGFLPV